jgi:non-ribosomal peptide synthetase component F
MFFLAVLNLELYHLTDEKDILIGSPVAGRNHIDLEHQIGLYLNYLILRNTINRTSSFKEFLSNIKQSTLEAYKYQEYPYDRLVEELKPLAQPGRNPFYDVMLVMNNSLLADVEKEIAQFREPMQASDFGIERKTSKLDLSLFVNDDPEISISVEYSTELFKEGTIVNLEKSLRHIIKLIHNNIETSIGDIAWELSGMDREELLGSTIDEISENF